MDNIDIDLTPPVLTAARAPLANTFGWNNSDVTVAFSCTDALSGVSAPPADVVVSGEGANQSASAACGDAARYVAKTTQGGISIDKTAPAVVGGPGRAPDANGWYNRMFSVTWTGTDALSSVAACDPPSSYSGPDAAGGSLAGACRDRAGNEGRAVFAFQFDATPPAIAIAQPLEGATYRLNQLVTAS